MSNPGNAPDEQQPERTDDVDKRRAEILERKGLERGLQRRRERIRQRGGR
jgi:hypothetical protein